VKTTISLQFAPKYPIPRHQRLPRPEAATASHAAEQPQPYRWRSGNRPASSFQRHRALSRCFLLSNPGHVPARDVLCLPLHLSALFLRPQRHGNDPLRHAAHAGQHHLPGHPLGAVVGSLPTAADIDCVGGDSGRHRHRRRVVRPYASGRSAPDGLCDHLRPHHGGSVLVHVEHRLERPDFGPLPGPNPRGPPGPPHQHRRPWADRRGLDRRAALRRAGALLRRLGV